MNEEKPSLFLKCDCYSHLLELQRYEYDKHDQGFYVAMWKHQNCSPKMHWALRLRWCWTLLTKGRLLADNIILTNEKAKEMANYITRYLPKEQVMGKKKKQVEETASEIPQMITEKQESSETHPPRYVVTRDGHRVSDAEYEAKDDPTAIAELEFWSKVEHNHSWGASVVIVQYDNRIHRVWDER